MKRLLLILVALAFAATACTDDTEPYAAKVNGKVIGVDALERQTNAIMSSPGYADLLNDQVLRSVGGLHPGGANTVNGEYTASLLFDMVMAELIDEELARKNIEITPAARAATEAQLREQSTRPGQPSLFDSLDARYRDYVVDVQTKTAALVERRTTPQAIADYYEANKAQFEQVCFRRTDVLNAEQARALKARATNGEDFLALLRESYGARQPVDQAGAPLDPAEPTCVQNQELPPADRQLLAPLAVNAISDPIVIGEAGENIVLQITSRGPQPFDAVSQTIRTTLGSEAALYRDLLRDARVEVNPRFGRLQRPTDDQQGEIGISPLRPKALRPAQEVAEQNASASLQG